MHLGSKCRILLTGNSWQFSKTSGWPASGKIRENQGISQVRFQIRESQGKLTFSEKIREKSGNFIMNQGKNQGKSWCICVFSPQPTNLAEGYCYPPFRPSIRPSVCPSVCPSVNICSLSATLWYEATVLGFWNFPQWKNIYCRCAPLRFQFDRPKIVEITGVWT